MITPRERQRLENKAGIRPEEKKALIEMQPIITKPSTCKQKPDHYAGPSLQVRF